MSFIRGKNNKNLVITCVTAVSIKQKLLEADTIIVHSLDKLINVKSVQILKHVIKYINTLYLHGETRRTIIHSRQVERSAIIHHNIIYSRV